ncbi:unnamed protein product [Rotaria sp. Silwood2]|nr:unnamed protein product [Rotaria sp. Silwood2]CAF3317239.1 unnamed protein product [Rotaria sp. Silwood2]CAF3997786.1 unnamed protein product [Rotaria sp. Silwood2]CAF4195445.1 unnamed protein product [Rotaria sp. Silwood2]
MDFKKLSKPLNQDYPNLQQHLNIEFNKIQTSWNELQAAYTNQIVRLQDLVIRARRGDIDQNYIPDALKDDQDKTLAKMINDCNDYLNAWDQKEQLIKDLVQKGFKYQNALDRNIKSGDDQQTLNGKLSTSDNRTCVICSNDNLYKNNSSRWHSLRDQLLKQREEDPQLQLIYVDFSYCSYKLDDMKVFSTGEAKNYESTPQPMSSLPLVQPKSEEIMNVLLLGESGVGKSTFINAFVNYLKFNNLQEAEKNTIVLIPVSFMMTTGDNFEEHLVKFEGKDDLSNEDHEHLGQSVTQHCKSYVFTLTDERSRGRKLRIVDTPGIGDTRGSSQDDANLQHILTYINNLTHLNAICILLKPNNARLNVFFRSCFMQLIDMLSENICDKIIFCFTNSRPAFYTPGNTATPLKALLQSLPIKTISFKQENTFCFDSESFRYLVARRNKIVFNDIEEQEYYDSWQKSSKESGRLIAYIRTKISTGIDPNQSYSVKQAQLKIYLMSRPILESMRNILRNIILSNVSKSRKVSLKLYPKTIRSPIAICLKCPRESIKIAEFWFTMDKLHVFINNKCRTCQCDPSDHYPIDYELVYKQTDDLSSKSENDIMNMLNDLCKTSAEFAHFLLESGGSSEHDPFLLGWKRMIQEEDDICAKKCSYELNFKLMQELQQLKDGYEKTKREMARRKESIELVDVYKKIENMSKCEMIELQMVAIREWHKNMIIYYEYEVPT